jgi:integrase
VRNSRDRYLDGDGVKSILDACPDWLKPIVLTALYTGGRRAEVLGLTWERIDFKAGTITYADTKNSDARKVPMCASVRGTMKALPNRLRGGAVFLRDTPVSKRRIEQLQRYAAVTPQSIAEAGRVLDGIFKPTPTTALLQGTSGKHESVSSGSEGSV